MERSSLKGVMMGIWHPAQDVICIYSPFYFNDTISVRLDNNIVLTIKKAMGLAHGFKECLFYRH
jgi:hypothetical protein